MITFLLVAQTGEAFAVSSMACFGSERGMIVSDMPASGVMGHQVSEYSVGHANGHSQDAEPVNDDETEQMTQSMQMMDHDCCQQDCCQQDCDCPIGMLSLAVLIDLNIQAATHQSDDQLVDRDSSLVFTFIPGQQRPPKYLSSFIG